MAENNGATLYTVMYLSAQFFCMLNIYAKIRIQLNEDDAMKNEKLSKSLWNTVFTNKNIPTIHSDTLECLPNGTISASRHCCAAKKQTSLSLKNMGNLSTPSSSDSSLSGTYNLRHRLSSNQSAVTMHAPGLLVIDPDTG